MEESTRIDIRQVVLYIPSILRNVLFLEENLNM